MLPLYERLLNIYNKIGKQDCVTLYFMHLIGGDMKDVKTIGGTYTGISLIF